MIKPISPTEISSKPASTFPIEIVLGVMNNILIERFKDSRIQKSSISKDCILDLINKQVSSDGNYYITYNFADWKYLTELYRAEGWKIQNISNNMIFFKDNPPIREFCTSNFPK